MDPFESRLKSLVLRAPSESFGQPQALALALEATEQSNSSLLEGIYRLPLKSKAALVLGIAAIVLVMCMLFSSLGGGSVAFAQVAEKLRSAQCLTFDTIITAIGQQEPKLRYRTSYMAPGKMRMDMGDIITIRDQMSGNMLTLNTKIKTAFVTTTKPRERSARTELRDPIDFLRSLVERSALPLGEKEIDGQKAKGFECDIVKGLKYTIWVNANTGDPVRVEYPMKFGIPDATVVETNFKLNEPLDPAIFDTNPPEGYKVIEHMPVDVGPILKATPAENVVEILQAYAKISGGDFPKHIDDFGEVVIKISRGDDVEARNQSQQVAGRIGALEGGYLFQHQSGVDYEYLPGGKLGEKDRIVFWYRDDKSGDYMAVYGDLRIEKVEKDQLPKKTNEGQK
jgi:outer membrane lipoprotein-sorting protein